MHYIGVDYHKRYSYIVVKDEEGKPERRGTVANSREEIQHFLEPYRPGKAVLEATRNWGLIYDWLEEVLDDVALAHPLKVKAIAEARIKTDKMSADILADLLRAGLLPRAYAASKQTRHLKNVLRQRMFFEWLPKNWYHCNRRCDTSGFPYLLAIDCPANLVQMLKPDPQVVCSFYVAKYLPIQCFHNNSR